MTIEKAYQLNPELCLPRTLSCAQPFVSHPGTTHRVVTRAYLIILCLSDSANPEQQYLGLTYGLTSNIPILYQRVLLKLSFRRAHQNTLVPSSVSPLLTTV